MVKKAASVIMASGGQRVEVEDNDEDDEADWAGIVLLIVCFQK